MKKVIPLIFSLALGLITSAGSADYKPNLGPDLSTITLKSGDLTVLMRQATQWTPGRIDFRGNAMTTERSAYGTVFMYPEIGFIGTGHFENEPEELQSLTFLRDGKAIEAPSSVESGKTIAVIRESKIRTFRFTNRIELRDNQLFETVTVKTEKETPLKLVYHFMHAWTPTVSAYLAGSDGEAPDGGPLIDDVERGFHINKPVDWAAVFEPVSRQFAISRVLEVPAGVKTTSKIWNVPGTYRKYYLESFNNAAVPAGFEGTWRMVTAFGESEKDQWEAKAEAVAAKLRPTE
ncbi:hypothetical protein VSU19_18890 [Verrucomicrobiales bacterium BCK34]|nr:hypothetical protein [Verrucomicrobiales bacterium BCK34]